MIVTTLTSTSIRRGLITTKSPDRGMPFCPLSLAESDDASRRIAAVDRSFSILLGICRLFCCDAPKTPKNPIATHLRNAARMRAYEHGGRLWERRSWMGSRTRVRDFRKL